MKPLYETDKFKLYHFHDLMRADGEMIYRLTTHYREWWDDQTVNAKNHHGLFPLNLKEYKQILKAGENGKILNWGIVHESEGNEYLHIGNISLQRIDWINRSAEFAVVIGEKDYWGKGICTDAAKILFDHGFNKLNLHRIWSGTAHPNFGMRKVFEKLGMKNEGFFRDGMYLNGKYENVYAYGILKSQWRKK